MSSLEALFDSDLFLHVKTFSGCQAGGDGALRHVLPGGVILKFFHAAGAIGVRGEARPQAQRGLVYQTMGSSSTINKYEQ